MSYQALNKLTNNQIANIHNQFAAICVNRFRDKNVAIEKTSKILHDAGITQDNLENWMEKQLPVEELGKGVEAKSAEKEVKKGDKKMQKRGIFKDKKIYIIKDATYKYNKGSEREKVIGQIVDGMSFDEFLKIEFATPHVLKIFVSHGNVEVR